jgi:hypothetical protein
MFENIEKKTTTFLTSLKEKTHSRNAGAIFLNQNIIGGKK